MEGVALRAIGSKGTDAGKFQLPRAIAFKKDVNGSSLAVTDSKRVQLLFDAL